MTLTDLDAYNVIAVATTIFMSIPVIAPDQDEAENFCGLFIADGGVVPPTTIRRRRRRDNGIGIGVKI
jgi:hypothetical protein